MTIVPTGIDKKGDKKKNVIREDVYKEAMFYYRAANILEKSRASEELFPPVLMNASFACELFSKYILCVSQGGKIPKKHSLWELYDEFDESNKEYLIKASNKSKDRWERFIQGIADMFEIWRYRYEYEISSAHYSFVLEYMKLIKELADSKY